jgi:hypothetical protein
MPVVQKNSTEKKNTVLSYFLNRLIHFFIGNLKNTHWINKEKLKEELHQ